MWDKGLMWVFPIFFRWKILLFLLYVSRMSRMPSKCLNLLSGFLVLGCNQHHQQAFLRITTKCQPEIGGSASMTIESKTVHKSV